MDSRLAFGAVAALLALAVFAGWRGMRPWDPRKGPRLMPWRWIMLLSVTAALLALIEVSVMMRPG